MRAFAEAVLPPLLWIAEIVTAALLFAMMVLTFVDVIGRYVFTTRSSAPPRSSSC